MAGYAGEALLVLNKAPLAREKPQPAVPLDVVVDAAVEILRRYVSVPTARSIATLARKRASSANPGAASAHDLLGSFESHLKLFLHDSVKTDECIRALRGLVVDRATSISVRSVPIRVEDDIARVRREARELALKMSFSIGGQTRLVTSVSELARNIVQYAGEGRIELTEIMTPASVEVVAIDSGPGISNLEQILGGAYKSRRGLGLGLRGVQLLADQFAVQTAAGAGTKVRFVLKVA